MIDFLTTNYLWIAAVVFLVAMPRRGGCGGHHSHRDQNENHARPAEEARPEMRAR